MGLKRMPGVGWWVLVAGGFLLLAAGCESTPQTSAPGAPVDQLPWNTPATWENSVIGVPY
ncbi:MAG: hypothetical protein WC708_02005 [Lentisphaeria bacterium]